MDLSTKRVFLVTGGHGFIGSHVSRRLYNTGKFIVKIIDTNSKPPIEGPLCHEFLCGDLSDDSNCEVLVRGVDTILHFAANMGGMGAIHDHNGFTIYQQNHQMTCNLVKAALNAGVKLFFYASSACVYPESLQANRDVIVSLRENDVWANPPPKPQGLYGLEKLISELLLAHVPPKMDIRIARFHNVYGPGGTWNDGREKAPAALLRKAIALKKSTNYTRTFEVWGDGQQQRSFLYIDDAVDGILKLLDSSVQEPTNIGSDTAISIFDLAKIALQSVGVNPETVSFTFDPSKPIGVASRNSDNSSVSARLGWKPRIDLNEGMKRTGTWIELQMNHEITLGSGTSHHDYSSSKLLDLDPQELRFGLLLPITSRGTARESDCLDHLRNFARSLIRTTWRDIHEKTTTQYRFTIYLAIDYDDTFLLPDGPDSAERNKARAVLVEEGLFDIASLACSHPRGHVCKIWKECAKRAWKDGCDYFVLFGDDVVLHDEGWMRDAHAVFTEFARVGTPFGFGCVAFTDITFPGMPTFPIIHRTHMEIFNGEVVPDAFINQDGDPFLFQLYRRWNCSVMFSNRLSNGVGGGDDCRYQKKHTPHWTFDVLDTATHAIESWLKEQPEVPIARQLTLDVVVPCYRVDLKVLDQILSLKSSRTCSTMFIIIIDNPDSPFISKLVSSYAHRPDVRIRTNKVNSGASASRNRGMGESAAEWVHFLDDDVFPQEDLLFKAEEVIREHPHAAGFVGNTIFPSAKTVFTAAVHLANVTYFWDIAAKRRDDLDLPWGVTANLIARRNVKDSVEFDLIYPKTGGGEDIDFCQRKRDFVMQNMEKGEGFVAAPFVQVTHPWWNGGSRSYWRFYNWSVGDGALIKQFPQHTFLDFAPNAAECLLLCSLIVVAGIASAQWTVLLSGLQTFIIVVLANVIYDCYRHLYLHPERNEHLNITIGGIFWIAAVVESTFIRVVSEMGRLRGLIHRGDYRCLGYRFDWFTGRGGPGPIREERMNNVQIVILSLALRYLFFLCS